MTRRLVAVEFTADEAEVVAWLVNNAFERVPAQSFKGAVLHRRLASARRKLAAARVAADTKGAA